MLSKALCVSNIVILYYTFAEVRHLFITFTHIRTMHLVLL